LKKAVLELGGKDPLIVDAGVDPVWAAEQAATATFANSGERIYVHREVAEDFCAELVRAAERTDVGPLIDAAQRDLVAAHVADALDRGARVLAGGEIPDGPGFFYPPTVLVAVDETMRVMREETLGPVAAIAVVESFEEALARANEGDYGRAATVLTPSQLRAARAAAELDVAMVAINAVPGGERRYAPELLDEVTQVKVVHLEPCPSVA
jgi:succinate-semialdehyde dehydrogenase/glutarate-semialdehyde dehydrogenase